VHARDGSDRYGRSFVQPVADNRRARSPSIDELRSSRSGHEYLEYAFAFSPYVYREHWTDADGNDGSYYVMSFAVAR
jgi:hypothetical protein